MWEELGQRRKRVFLGIAFSPPQKPSAVHGRGPCLPQPLPVTSASRKVMEHAKHPRGTVQTGAAWPGGRGRMAGARRAGVPLPGLPSESRPGPERGGVLGGAAKEQDAGRPGPHPRVPREGAAMELRTEQPVKAGAASVRPGNELDL